MTDRPSRLRQHAVDDQHVVVAVGGQRSAGSPSPARSGDMAGLAQRLGQIVGGFASSSIIRMRMARTIASSDAACQMRGLRKENGRPG